MASNPNPVSLNKLDRLLRNPTTFLRWLDEAEGDNFRSYLQDYRNEVLAGLVKEADTVEFHRLQGKMQVLDSILGLRGEMSRYIRGVSLGTMKKI